MQRLARLDGLRGVLAAYVVLGHAMPFAVVPLWVSGPVRHGQAAVDLFFCLSGLVVVNSLERFGYRAGPFFVARARRLLPVYWVVLAAAAGLLFLGSPVGEMGWVPPRGLAAEFWALGPPAGFWWHLAAHVALVQGVVPQGALPWVFISLLGPAWSLSTEWQFYGVLAAFMRPGRLAGVALGLAFVAVMWRFGEGLLPAWWGFSRAFLPDAAGYFGLGMASALALRDGEWWPFGVVLAVVVGLGFWSGEASKGLIGVVWAVVFLVQIHDRVPVLPALLESRVAQYLGAISYPLYLVNEPVQRVAAMLLAPQAHGDGVLFTVVWLPVALAGCLLAADGLHRWVEVPFMRGAPPGMRRGRPPLAKAPAPGL